VFLEEIARRAGVGAAILYRHFPSKDDLVRAVIEYAFADQVEPVLRRALHEEQDALTGLVTVLEAAMTMISQHRNAVAAARQPGQFPVDVVAPFFERLAIVLAKAQQQGTVRSDLRADDLPRLTLMVLNTMWLNDVPDNWRRYLMLLLDALQPAAARPLPPVTPVTAPLPPLTPQDGATVETQSPPHPRAPDTALTSRQGPSPGDPARRWRAPLPGRRLGAAASAARSSNLRLP
jgi:AcrR family transcriptional regulator